LGSSFLQYIPSNPTSKVACIFIGSHQNSAAHHVAPSAWHVMPGLHCDTHSCLVGQEAKTQCDTHFSVHHHEIGPGVHDMLTRSAMRQLILALLRMLQDRAAELTLATGLTKAISINRGGKAEENMLTFLPLLH
jgi:hypothetical protein